MKHVEPDGHLPALRSRPWLMILLILFVGSGCSALVYEIVWFQLLQLVIGSSSVSLGVLLGTFMGGMCLGSVLLSRIIGPRHHPLRVYALLELGIGILGVLLLLVMPLVGRFYIESVGHGTSGILLRAVVCALCLLPPTVLMGATLPAISRWIETTPQGVARLGFFYGANIAGAVFGCLLAGFYLLRIHDVATATYVAVAINAAVAGISWLVARYAPYRIAGSEQVPAGMIAARGSWPVYLTIALSGMCAMGAEVIWTRQLSLMLGASVYTFSIILAVFLVGLGLGSGIAAVLTREWARPGLALAWCQLLLAGAIAWSAYSLSRSLPYWPIDPSLSRSPWFSFQLDLLRCAWATLPATCLWGASFPLALAAAAWRGQDPGRLVGGVYAANTLGAILGALGFSMLAIEMIGTQNAQRLLIVVSALSAVLMLTWLIWRSRRSDVAAPTLAALPGLGMVAVAVLAAALNWTVPSAPRGLVGYGRYLPTWRNLPDFLFVGEGMNASIAVSEFDNGVRNFHVSGKVVASSEPQDMRLQRMLGHVPALLHPQPRSVLIVGCGAGVTAGTFVLHPDIERIVICEIEPLIPTAAGLFFADENHGVVDDPRVEVIYDDARHYVLTTREKFDIITSDPIHPWVKGAAALYSQEYFQMCRDRLNPGGIVTQWVPLYESNLEAVKSEVATFFKVFPHGTIWSNDVEGEGYDVVMLGTAEPTRINVDALQQRLDRSDHEEVRISLDEVQLGSATLMLATYAGRGPDLGEWLADAQINRDQDLRLQYLAGMGLNSNESGWIYESMLMFRKFPEDLFIASRVHDRALRKAIPPSSRAESP